MSLRGKLKAVVRRIRPYKPKPLILMYHRIADELLDHWCLAVSPAHFEEQLDVLRRTRRPMPLSKFVFDFMAGTLAHDAVALTFDDGYVDNLFAAKPRLAVADVPASVFLATGYVGGAERFWWDELARLILLEDSPPTFELTACGKSMYFDFSTEPAAREDGSTPAGSLKLRRAALWTLRETLRPLEDEERRSVLAKLRSIFGGRDYHASLGRAMTSDEVLTLVADGLVTIGAHTVTHPVLPKLDPAACHHEIEESKTVCESLIGAPVTGFAYPYGDFDAGVREAVRTAGFAFACSVQSGPVTATSDIFALPRIHVHNCDGDAFARALRAASAVE